MQLKAILKILGILLMLFSFSMLTPVFVSLYFHGKEISVYFFAFGLTFFTGLFLYSLFFRNHIELKVRDGFLVVVLFWTVLSAFAALPLLLGAHYGISFTDAVFESVSGFTTTGSSVIPDLHLLPPALLFYRQQLQFLGGMGIIVLAVAILPMLGIGGMQLYRAEMPGPLKDDKLTPRITENAKVFCIIYLSLVTLCAISYWLSGMMPLDALEESFSTISTGGFSTHNQSFAYYNSRLIEIIGICFMFLGGTNFSLHYLVLLQKNIKYYWKNTEFKLYFSIIVITSSAIALVLWLHNIFQESTFNDITQSLFNVVSVMTTTGFVSADYASWPIFTPFLMMCVGLLGACSSSTSGGLKLIRLLVLIKQVSREIKRLIHPQGVYPLRLEDRILPAGIVSSVWAFITVYFGILFFVILLLMTTGMNLDSAFGAAAAAVANIGCGMGQYAYSLTGITTFAKWVLIIAMLIGRLEVFTILVIFSRAFWKK